MSEVNTVDGDQSIFDDAVINDVGEADISTASNDDDSTAKDGNNDRAEAEGDNNGRAHQKGEKTSSGTPPEGEDDKEAVTDDKGQKFIPEHRFKAALKKVTEERDAAMSKLAEHEKPEPIQVPDKETDPEGYSLHMRMEQSQAVMRDLVPDYQEKIDHFAKMADLNPLLNQAVAAHAIPAKLAYDIAAKDLEIKEALSIKGSDDWKKFQEWQKTHKDQPVVDSQTKLNEKVARSLGRTVPNLNRSTNLSPTRSTHSSDDDVLFNGAL